MNGSRIKLNTETVSISRTLDNYEREEARKKNEASRKYEFLDDVPDYQRKISLYRLFNDYHKLREKYGNFEYYSNSAKQIVNLINAEYGEGSAKFIPAEDPKGKKGFRIIIMRPTVDEFQSILDKNGDLLPMKQLTNNE